MPPFCYYGKPPAGGVQLKGSVTESQANIYYRHQNIHEHTHLLRIPVLTTNKLVIIANTRKRDNHMHYKYQDAPQMK